MSSSSRVTMLLTKMTIVHGGWFLGGLFRLQHVSLVVLLVVVQLLWQLSVHSVVVVVVSVLVRLDQIVSIDWQSNLALLVVVDRLVRAAVIVSW